MTEPGAQTSRILRRRRAAERRFRRWGRLATAFALTMLVTLLASILFLAASAFMRHEFRVVLAPQAGDAEIGRSSDPRSTANLIPAYMSLVEDALVRDLPEGSDSPVVRRETARLFSRLAIVPVAEAVARDPERLRSGKPHFVAASDDLDLYLKRRNSQETRLDWPDSARSAEPAGGDIVISGTGAFGPLVSMLDNWATTDLADPAAPSVLVILDEAAWRIEQITPDRAVAQHLMGSAGLPTVEDLRTGKLAILWTPEAQRTLSDMQVVIATRLQENGAIKARFNTRLFTASDSTYPELAGTLAALVGSLLTLFVTALMSIPVGVMAALYLEEFAPRNRLTALIEVSINNLAAVPTIIFGLLGAAVFINLFGFPRSAPLVGGLVLALLTLPTIIIASRAALFAVPAGVRDAALSLGASRMQTVLHHVLPLATPGILTGAIIGMARALGETAPLLLIGMVAFIAEVPTGVTDEATTLPVLIYKWSTGAERAWEPLTAAAIVILLLFLLVMNAGAIWLRQRFGKRW